jgi:glycosyltransferase involved in cell wall biosynthesis
MFKSKLLIYTDCDFFAGCEKPIENITNYPKIIDQYDVTFVYRFSKKYADDLTYRNFHAKIKPIFIPNPNEIIKKVNQKSLIFLPYKVCIRILERLQIFNLIYFFKQLKILVKERPYIVHINNGGYPGADSCRIMAITSRLMKINKIIFTVNNMAVPVRDLVDKFIDYLVNVSVDSFVTASNAASEQLINVRKIECEKTQSIPNAVLNDEIKIDENVSLREEFNIEKDSLLIGSAGLLIDRKGYDVLIKAANVITKTINWRIFVFGDGPQRALLEKMIEEYNLQDRFYLPGFRDNVHSYINEIDIFTLSSTGTEDMPNAINEAMLIGKPIVGTRTSGVPEQIDHGVNGFLVNQGDYKDLAKKLEDLLKLNKNELAKIGKKSYKKYINSFSYNLAMDKYFDTYNNKIQ